MKFWEVQTSICISNQNQIEKKGNKETLRLGAHPIQSNQQKKSRARVEQNKEDERRQQHYKAIADGERVPELQLLIDDGDEEDDDGGGSFVDEKQERQGWYQVRGGY